jgi:Protein of unknown function (DUF4019)
MMNRHLNKLVACFGLLLVFGCSAGEAKKSAETDAVPTFHAQYDRSDFEAIYKNARDEFREATSRDDFEKFMSAVRRKLGKVKSSSRQTWKVNVGTGGTRIVLTYNTEFELGKGVETFTILNGKLLGYNVNSNTLIVN